MRRHRQSHAAAALLVHVVKHLRKIFGVERRTDIATFLLGYHVPVTIVVVSDVLVIQPRHRAAFERCAESFLVPVDDHLHAIGIGRWDEQDDRVLQRLLQRVCRRQRIGEFHRHLARTDFAAVQIAVDPDDRGLRCHQRILGGCTQGARIGQTLLHCEDRVEAPDIIRCRNRRHNHRTALRRDADRVELDAGRSLRECGEVAQNLRPVGQCAVSPHRNAEHVARGRNRSLRRRTRNGRSEQQRGTEQAQYAGERTTRSHGSSDTVGGTRPSGRPANTTQSHGGRGVAHVGYRTGRCTASTAVAAGGTLSPDERARNGFRCQSVGCGSCAAGRSLAAGARSAGGR